MKALILPVVLLLAGTGAGVGAGMFLSGSGEADAAHDGAAGAADHAASDPAAIQNPCGELPMAEGDHAGDGAAEETELGEGEAQEGREYVRLNNQFVVPVVDTGEVSALVVLSLSLEVPIGTRDDVFAHEPKIRDSFLQVLFDHANIGGFTGNFTSSSNMRVLRNSLREAAKDVMGGTIADVLIIDIVRQDIQN